MNTRTLANTQKVAMALAGLLLAGREVSAYSVLSTCNGSSVRWNSRSADMYVSTTSFPPGSGWDSRLQNAMWHWNAVAGSGFNFYVGRDTDGTHSSGNGVNEIAFEPNLGGALAVTRTRSYCYFFFLWQYGLVEADIVFDSNYAWTTGPYSYANPGGSPYNFEGVALHELGHALGLNHEDRWMATMNSLYPNGGPFGYYKEWDPFGDDRLGSRFLYPDGTVERDPAASALRRAGPGSSGLVFSPLWAYRGSTVTLEFTFSNLSSFTESFNIGFYLSTNEYISTSDTFLGANYGAGASPGGTGTFWRTLTVPTWIAPGTYYVGFLLDNDARIPESKEFNNNQQMPRTITIY